MFESLVITLREGIEISLALGIVITYLTKTGRRALLPWVWAGLALAVAGSLAGAAVLSRLPVNPELLEGVVMWAAAAMVATMVIWMHRVARHLKREIEEKLDSIATPERGSLGTGLALAAFSFLLVFREGAEMVLFLAAVRLSTDSLAGALGGVLGLGLAAVFGLSFVRGTMRIDLGKFFKVTEIVLLIFVAQLVVGGYHELSEAGVVPSGPLVMRLLGPVVKNNVLFVLALLALPLLVWVIPGTREQRMAREIEALEGAQRRRRLAQLHRDRGWRLAATATALMVISLLTVGHVYASRGLTLSPARPVEARGGAVRVPLASLADGHLERMSFEVQGVPVRFFAMKVGPDSYAACLDACQLCGTFGYVQEGVHLICLNCSAEINPDTLGESGGCNPVPLPSRVEGSDLVVGVEDLAAGRGAFARATGHVETLECKVCGMRLAAHEAVTVEAGGFTLHLCSMPQCRQAVEKAPERFR
ncbi:MAG TPA: Fe-S-containing protein [Candidatus Nitrosotenuis sp.]|jgi:FTR1 family protein|nr:Fe-S-containing protein [Candidatus Nitrosotenuis sp.]